MEKSYKYRIYPNKKQKVLIAKTFGSCSLVFLSSSQREYIDSRTSLNIRMETFDIAVSILDFRN